jgi:hypothetical protein
VSAPCGSGPHVDHAFAVGLPGLVDADSDGYGSAVLDCRPDFFDCWADGGARDSVLSLVGLPVSFALGVARRDAE